jgi:type IV pilus assembly protein PilP
MSTRLRTKALIACLLGGSLLIAGCVSNNMSDLETYVEEVKARKSGNIPPLPEIKPYERYLYQSAEEGRRDPFEPFYEEAPSSVAGGPAVDVEEQAKYRDIIENRNKEELEQFELDSLRMVGILEDGSNLWGIIRDQQGTVYRVSVGNFMGRNNGRITEIREDSIELREIVPSAQGQLEERTAFLDLVEQE